MNKNIIVHLLVLILGLVGCSDDTISIRNSKGEQLVKTNCKVCHAQGINGAPVIGNIKMWGPRIEKGLPTLISNATNGFGLMPAKGGSTLTDEEMAIAVEYLISQVKQ